MGVLEQVLQLVALQIDRGAPAARAVLGLVAPFQEMPAEALQPRADFAFLAGTHAFNLLGKVESVDLTLVGELPGGTLAQELRLALRPFQEVAVVVAQAALSSRSRSPMTITS